MTREIILSLLFALIFSCQPIFAQQSPVKGKGQSQTSDTTIERLRVPLNQMTVTGDKAVLVETGNTNILVNPGFETAIVSSGWTASAGTVAAATGENIGWGAKSVRWTPNAAGDTFMPGLVSIPNALKAGNAEASVWYSSSAFGNSLLVLDENSNVIAGVSLPATISYAKSPSLNFIAPGNLAGSLRPQIKAASNAPINLDEFRIGAATNIGTVAQSNLLGTVKVTGCSSYWTGGSTGGSPSAFPVQTSCVYTVTGMLQAPATMIPGFIIPKVPPGHIKIEYDGSISTDSVANSQVNYSFYDGTSDSIEVSTLRTPAANVMYGPKISGSFTYTSAQSNVTFQVRYNSAATNSYIGGTTAAPGVFKVYYYPTSSQTGVNISARPSYYFGYHDSTCSWSRTNTVLGAYTADASCALVQQQASEISCSATGSVLPAIACTFPRSGIYRICARFSSFGSVATGHGQQLTDGTNMISEGSDDSNAEPDSMTLCGPLSVAGTSATISLVGKAASGSVTVQSQASLAAIQWEIQPAGQNYPTPFWIGSVISNSAGQERIERLRTDTATCAISSQSGSWITGAGSHSSTAICSFTIASGMFSATPTCLATSYSANKVANVFVNSSTSFDLATIVGNTNSESTTGVNIICMGPR